MPLPSGNASNNEGNIKSVLHFMCTFYTVIFNSQSSISINICRCKLHRIRGFLQPIFMASPLRLRFGFGIGIRSLRPFILNLDLIHHCIEEPLLLLFQNSYIFRGGNADYHLESSSGLHGTPLGLLDRDEGLTKYGWKSSVFRVRSNIGWVACMPNL